jgi:Fic-DOC domain mobile mystery protein B
MLEEPGPGQTPLTKEQKAGLLLPLVTQVELNAAEADSIVNARTWAMVRSRSLSSAQVLREDWLKRLHKRMFDSIWKWAGTYRHADVNIGRVSWPLVPTAMREALDDSTFWVDHREQNQMTLVEVAVRIQHKLVAVHPFPNGNGRWSRLVADLIMRSEGGRPLSWGGGVNLQALGETRRSYLAALRSADEGDFRALITFAQS